MRRPIRSTACALLMAAGTLIAFAPTQASAATAGAAPVPSALPGSVAVSSPAATTLSPATAADVCTFYTRGDYVHVSSTAFEASGHGWWVNGNCPTTYAVVTVQLQEYYSDGSWRNQGSPSQATVRSGGGSSDRVTGRAGCSNSNLTGWRSVIDVDLVGLADDPGKLYTPSQNIDCRR
jgi:hypothetical protein